VTVPSEIIGYLLFSDEEPRIIGHLTIGGAHFEIAGIRRSKTRVDLEGEKIARTRWSDLSPTKQAAIRCSDPVFWAWLEEEGYPLGEQRPCNSNDDATMLVRILCGVASRSDLNKPANAAAREQWQRIDGAFQAWKVKERA
jgi:hypothetical protein